MTRCEDWCDEGYYGEGCNKACECPNTNYLCHPVLGCICQPRYSGHNCSTPAPISAVWPYTDLILNEENDSPLYIALFVAVVLIAIIGGAVFILRKKKKIRQLKTTRENNYNSEQRGRIWHSDKT